MILSLYWRIVLQYSPQDIFRHENLFNLHHMYKNVDHLISGIIKALASKKEFDNILAIDILVVFKENVERDVWFNHVFSQLFNCCLGS